MLGVCALRLVDGASRCVVVLRTVVLVADGEHEVGQNGKLEQTEPPVALVVLCVQILSLAAQRNLLVEAVLTLSHKNVRVNHSALALNNGLVVVLVHIHEVELEVLGEFLLNLHVDVLVVLLAALPERRTVAVCARCTAVVYVLLDGTDVREVELHACAVLAAEECLAVELVAELCLVSPLAVRLCGVRIERS